MIQLEDKLYTSTEVANVLGVSLRSVYRYLEEGKLDAEVKTATGRHRFSKKNILDFLYPSGIKEEKAVNISNTASSSESGASVVKQSATKKATKAPVIEESSADEEESVEEEVKPAKKQKVKEEPVAEQEPVEKEEELTEKEEEPIDWLAKFREAAKKYKEEAERSETVSETVTVEEETISSFGQDIAFEEEEPTPAKATKSKGTKKQYFRSNLGGLKDIAQNIDKGSRNSFLDYAFTMNAGLSLYKPIKPFSMLHAYVRETDLTFFEKLLGLTPTDEVNAQLCLLVTNDDKVFNSREELHGLYVVAKETLLKDVQEMGDSVLISEASSILK